MKGLMTPWVENKLTERNTDNINRMDKMKSMTQFVELGGAMGTMMAMMKPPMTVFNVRVAGSK